MTEQSSPSVKERTAAIERRVSLEADKDRQKPLGRQVSVDSSQFSYANSTANFSRKQMYTPNRSTSFQPLRPTRIFSRDIEERSLQLKRSTPVPISKLSHRTTEVNLDSMQSISTIRESIRKMKQRVDSTVVTEPSSYGPPNETFEAMTSDVFTPDRSSGRFLNNTILSATKRRSMETYDEGSTKKSNHRSTLAVVDHDISGMGGHLSVHGHVPHSVSYVQDQDRLVTVYAQYLQAIYKASHGEREFEREQAAAQERLERAHILLANRQDELNVSESKIRLASEISMLDELLKKQKDSLVEVASSLSQFKSPVDLYMERMDKSTFIVPLEEPMWDHLEILKEKVDECNDTLEELLNTHRDEKALRFITANQSTCMALKREIDLLCDCKQILSQ